MALVVKRINTGKGIREIVRIGAIERAKKTNIKYAVGFYRRNGIKNLLKDLEVDLWQLLFFIGREKNIKEPEDKNMPFSIEMGKWQ